ncbi:chemotaxis protein CheB [uncultured Thiodictyon sp.]|jgi:two-component system CheB/CheR fusion protein|uniref:chemotaxis protein CheB n=1 Tax=uncultured Thiodictyon sp. TaxID=1846217 RepID=UPI0025F3B9F0|nr:chemotaxis protein CheB [uncultured Thiodictyon sp.]
MKKAAAPPKHQSTGAPPSSAQPPPGAPAESTPVAPDGAPPLDQGFPIVGIGASAGGLEALELFLGAVPPTCGLAFVVVQHLDPTYQGNMAELLQRATAMSVAQIKDRLKVVPGHVYVIPPNRDLSILHGVLHLLEPVAPRGLRLPIDFFLRALAEDQHEQGLGVILSGMGSDGTLGLRAIKERGGAVFVQDPASAKFDSMPRSAIAAGLADVVAPPEQLAGRILAFLKRLPSLVAPSDLSLADPNQSALEKVVVMLRTRTGHDFSAYKKSTLYRRIERRLGLHQLDRIADYVHYVRENPQELDLLFKELLIGVTSFFRDPAVWEQLKTSVIPGLLAAHPDGATLRLWSAGCSTGEEAYSLAMVLREALAEVQSPVRYAFQVFATDLDRDAIDRARAGIYPATISADCSTERLHRFFVQNEHGYQVNKDIREMLIFATQNLVMDPPFTRLDLLFCRNLLIYLDAGLQKKLIPLFHYSLNPGGILVLGNSETIGLHQELFTPLPGKTRIYQRRDVARGNAVELPAVFAPAPTALRRLTTPAPLSAQSLQSLIEPLLLRHYCPAAVLATEQGDLVYISGKTGRYLEPAAGKVDLNVFKMAREGLKAALSEVFHKAVRQQASITVTAVKVAGSDGELLVDLSVQPLAEPTTGPRGMVLIVFTEVRAAPAARVPTAGDADARQDELAQELLHSREELQTTREEMQTSQEELRSANEELQSTNEELQSTNEELTTSKEEMQSMNEELQTVNHELQSRVEALSRVSDDLSNLLNSTDIATLFLDNQLKVRRFTTEISSIFQLIPGDLGRPISDLVSSLDYPGLLADSREVLRSLIFHEQQAATHDGRWFRVRIIPYRTQDNRIDGVAVTFVDISDTKSLEAKMGEDVAILQGRVAEQATELEAAGRREDDLRTARTLPERRLADLTEEPRGPRGDTLAGQEP